MKISDLPPGLRELAEKRMSEYRLNYARNFDENSIFYFDWDESPEGLDYWSTISIGHFEIYYGCQVTNFKLKNK